jgi:hypothetical protein
MHTHAAGLACGCDASIVFSRAPFALRRAAQARIAVVRLPPHLRGAMRGRRLLSERCDCARITRRCAVSLRYKD